MEKKTYYIEVAWMGSRDYEQVPVCCEEKDLDLIATAVGKGYKADSCVVFLTGGDNTYSKPYMVLWDCM